MNTKVFVNKPNVELLGQAMTASPRHDSLLVSWGWESNEYLTLVRVPPDPHVCEQDDHSAHTKIIKYII